MGEQQHTPAPWRVLQSGFGTTVWAGGENNPSIIADKGDHLPATIANARLIATAPDMAAEIKQCAAELEEAANIIRPTLPSLASIYDRAAERARATHAKATGASDAL